MDFIHCNVCGGYPFSCQRYFLASCGHVVCENCSRKATETCLVCGIKCRLIEINAQASQEVKLYFTDGSELLRDNMKRTVHVMQFQKQHIKSLGAHYQRTLTAYESLRNQYDISKQENELLKAENEELKKKLENLEQCEQNIIGYGSIQNPLELGMELFGDHNKEMFPSFLNKRSDSISVHTPIMADTCHREEKQRQVRDFGAIGTGRPISSYSRPSPIGQTAASIYSSNPSISTGYNYHHQPRDRLTLCHTPKPRSANSPSPVHLSMGKGNFISPAITLRTPGSGSRYNFHNNPGSGSNDIVERLKKLNCQKMN